MTAYTDAVTADAPIYWYKLDETSGGTIVNSGSAGTLNLTTHGGVTQAVTGIDSRNAAYFDGTNNAYLNANFPNTINTATGSMEFWIKTDDIKGSDSVIFDWGNSSGSGSLRVVMTNGGFIKVYKNNGTRITSTTQVSDGDTGSGTPWVHVVIVHDGSNGSIIYINGVAAGTASGTAASGGSTSAGYIGYLVGGTAIKGNLDEIAFYSTALSSTRVAAHYAAATGTSVAVDVTTPTMSMDIVAATVPNTSVTVTTPTMSVTGIDATVGAGVGVDLTTPTMSLASNDVTVESETVVTDTIYGTADGHIVKNTGAFTDGTTNPLSMQTYASGNAIVVKAALPTAGVVDIKKVELALNVLTSTGPFRNGKIYTITSDWTPTGTPTLTLSSPISFTAWDTGTQSYDVSSIVDEDNFYGFYMIRDGGDNSVQTTVSSLEDATTSYRPKMLVTYSYEPTSVNIDVDTGTASMVSVEATAAVQTVTEVSTGTMSMANYDVTVEAGSSPNTEVILETPTASMTHKDVTVSINTVIDATTPTEAMTSNDVEVVSTQTEIIELETGRATMVAVRPSEVNGEPVTEGEDDDLYFVSTRDKAPVFWYRGNEAPGGILPNRGTQQAIGGVTTNLVNHGATIAVKNGPESRATIQFDGNDYLQQTEGSPDEITGSYRTLEFTMKTGKANQYLFGGADSFSQTGDNAAYTGDINFYLADGKLRQRRTRPANPSQNIPAEDATLWTAFTNLADNQWHHIAIRSYAEGQFGQNGFLEVWIDDKLEIRRVGGVALTLEALAYGFPDYIGGRPGLPAGTWFEGNFTEFALYNYYMSEDDIVSQRDAMFGVIPIRVETGRMTMKNNPATVKGNKTRMLWLNFGHFTNSAALPTPVTDYKVSFESFPEAQVYAMMRGNINTAIDVGTYQFFHTDVYHFIDERTEERRLIDLDKDINMADFDAIGFIGYPKTSDQLTQTIINADEDNNGLNGRTRLDKLLADIKTQIVLGKNVLITNPQLAADLGFINDFKFAATLREQFNPGFNGDGTVGPDSDYLYDAIAAQRDVFSNAGMPNDWAQFIRFPKADNNVSDAVAGRYFSDTHANDRYRIRRLVPGLTDIPASIFTDELHYIEPISFATDWIAYKYGARPNGLTIGDEFYWEGGIKGGARLNDLKDPNSELKRGFGTFATPINAVKTGTVVATFAETIGEGTEIVLNPYKDYATVIAIEPGSTLTDGRTVAGKVFIDFTDRAVGEFFGYNMPKQLVPTNAEQDANLQFNQRHKETDAQRAWDFSKWRGVTSSGSVITRGAKYGLAADGSLTVISPGDSYTPTVYSGWWPLSGVGIETMMSRGFIWLSKANENNGNALVGVETAKMTMDAKAVTVDTVANVSVDVTTARATMEAVEMFDVVSPNVSVIVPTPSMTMAAISFQEIVEVETGRMTMRAVEIEGTVVDESEIIGLTLHGGQALITLNIKEEA